MLTQNEYLGIIDAALARVLAERLPAEPRGLYDPIRYALSAGGKRLRPMLCLAVGDALGADPEAIVNQALAVEIFHNFTLVHDDVMDNAELRRGRPTVHCRWNDNTAILSGDAMLTFASIVLADGAGHCLPEALRLLDKTAMEVYEGQQLDMDFEDRLDVGVDDYLAMIRLKTAVLLGCACAMGAVMAGADDLVRHAFYDYGIKLGMAFQLRDDYLDTFGDPAVFGKQIGGDILADKKTWLLINALQRDASQTVASLVGNTSTEPSVKIARVKEVYRRLGLDRECQALADAYLADADAALACAGISETARRFFLDLTEKTRSRCI